jgi:hypothetical protein
MFPEGLISLVLDYSTYDVDDFYGFDTLDLFNLPSTLCELRIISRSDIRLTGVLPVGLQMLYTSDHLIVDCRVPATVEHITGRVE